MRLRTRAGFTLIELMVSMALTLLIMVILSQAFVLALETFSGLKGLGDMQQLLRTASTQILSDLSNDHFEGKRRLSDPDITLPGARIQAGFFVVRQGSVLSAPPNVPYADEDVDQNGFVRSQRAVDHFLYFTVKRKGNRQEDFFTAALQPPPVFPKFSQNTAFGINQTDLATFTLTTPGAGFYGSQWAEVAYYLERTGSTEEPNNATSQLGTPTFALRRAQFVMVPDSTGLKLAPPASQIVNGEFSTTYEGMSCNPTPPLATSTNPVIFYSPTDVAQLPPIGGRTLDPAQFTTVFTAPAAIPPSTFVTTFDPRITANNSTLLLPNVISFQVQIMPNIPGSNTFVDILNGGLYDTTQFGASPNTFGLKAIQITLRVFDTKTRQSRQMTIVQDL